MIDIDRKRELIVESALKRFSHFGIQKTTMNEIADDISVTQPSLYHYFPDKMSLVVAVVEKIMTEYFVDLEHTWKTSEGLKQQMTELLMCRKMFFKRYFMLNLAEASPEAGQIQQVCHGVMEQAKLKEAALLSSLLKKASENGEIAVVDADKMSRIYLDAVTGLSLFTFISLRNKFSPGEKDFNQIFEKQKELTMVFLSGLRFYGIEDRKL